MEGSESKPLPEEKATKGMSLKLIAAIIAVILVIAAIGGILLMSGGEAKNEKPTASLTVDATGIAPGEMVTLNGTGSSDKDGKVVEYWWYFGDSMLVTATAKVSHYYYLEGSYILGLKVKDDKGAVSDMSTVSKLIVSIETNPDEGVSPIAVIDSSAESAGNIVAIGSTVSLSGDLSWASVWNNDSKQWEANNSGIHSYDWIVGGTNKSALKTWDFKFWQEGIFGVLLTVTDDWLITGQESNTTGQAVLSVQVLPSAGSSLSRADTYLHATIGEPQSLDPAWDYESAGGVILNNAYNTLIGYAREDASIVLPELALEVPTVGNGLLSADGLNYTFNIRPNVKFHDGSTLTADDVIYTIKRVLLMNDVEGAAWMLAQCMLPTYKGLNKPVNKAEVNASIIKVDADTVKFKLCFPYPGFIYILAYTVGSIVSQSYVEAHGGMVYDYTDGDAKTAGVQPKTNATHAKVLRNSHMDRNVMGTGPFKLKEWTSNDRLVMERYDGYWEGPATLKYFIYKKVQNLGTREMMLFKGTADSIYVPISNRADVETSPGVGKSGIRIHVGQPTLSLVFNGFNWNIKDGLEKGDIPATFFSDANVRKAFIHAFDGDSYIHDITLDTALRPTGPVPSGLLGYDPTVPYAEYNISLSAEYLKKALDTRTPDPTDTYADNGFTVWLYYNAGNTGRQAGCQMLKQSLESLSNNADYGITGTIVVNVQALDWPVYLDARGTGKLPVFFLGWSVDYPDPDDFVNPFCHEAGAFPVMLDMVNHTLTALVEQAARELNSTLRAQIYSEIAWSCYENGYYIWVSQPVNFHVERTWVNGYVFNVVDSENPGDWYALSKS